MTATSESPVSRLLPGKVVVVTGASTGIGRATAIGESQALTASGSRSQCRRAQAPLTF